jgi:hypothetical protein
LRPLWQHQVGRVHLLAEHRALHRDDAALLALEHPADCALPNRRAHLWSGVWLGVLRLARLPLRALLALLLSLLLLLLRGELLLPLEEQRLLLALQLLGCLRRRLRVLRLILVLVLVRCRVLPRDALLVALLRLELAELVLLLLAHLLVRVRLHGTLPCLHGGRQELLL